MLISQSRKFSVEQTQNEERMKNIAYYISDYGYGHAARSIAVIRELLAQSPDIHIIICHSFAVAFLKQSLPANRVTFRVIETDIGYVLKENSIEPDPAAMEEKLAAYMDQFDDYINEETRFLLEKKVRLVISDISPLAFPAAASAGVPSVGLSNFTWHTAYRGLINEAAGQKLKRAYKQADYFFHLAGGKEQNWGQSGNRSFGFFSRSFNRKKLNEIRQRVNPAKNNIIIYFGLGMKIEVENIQTWPFWKQENCVFIVSSNVQIKRPNVFHIPENESESQNYIGAADIVLSKPGWGIVSEAVCAGRSLIVLDRPDLEEDQRTIAYLRNQQLATTIRWEELVHYQFTRPYAKQHSFSINQEKQKIAQELLDLLK